MRNIMSDNPQYIKFMSDLIESGIWADLSSSARCLYPVLLKFSDQSFKYVWPSTETLLKLTGFKTKKSIIQAKKDLISHGLLQTIQGTGHTNTRYYFTFNYPNSKITPQGYRKIHPMGGENSDAEVEKGKAQAGQNVHPNHINITITNNSKNENPKNFIKNKGHQKLIQMYGIDIFSSSYKIAEENGLEKDYSYILHLCKEKVKNLTTNEPKFNQNKFTESFESAWSRFIFWSNQNLTSKTVSIIEKLNQKIDGKTILIEGEMNEFIKQVVCKYFSDKEPSKFNLLFVEGISENENRVM